ncbi:integrase core domain-containing protein, partial [Streptomyces sp. NPDC126497]|uniref:integrase core domain-containing protein n=1 Tax=Streptomyces sp. NPDC126497 TaxID=3155313 RepID=UPI003329DE84
TSPTRAWTPSTPTTRSSCRPHQTTDRLHHKKEHDQPTAQAARLAVFRWLGFYNHRRRHSTIGYLTPVAFEQRSTTLAIAA